MLYISSRGKSNEVNSMEAIKYGLASDGGLFVPSIIPELSSNRLDKMMNFHYADIAKSVLGEFLSDYQAEDIEDAVNGAYNEITFDSPQIVPVVKASDDLFIQELWHGPTCAFKDIALQVLPRLMTSAMKRTQENLKIAILVATSGDTGKAALEGFKDVPQTAIIVFYPEDGVSDMQKLQMASQEGSNVCVVAVKGNFDDAQTGVKAIFTDADLAGNMAQYGWRFSSANSINWGRLVPQIVYYISAYINMIKNKWLEVGEPFNAVVPTGNFGNILAAYYAKTMGLPINKLICASNSNNVLTDFINTGRYDSKRAFHNTMSPSMDILISSNLERLLFELSGKDAQKVRSWMSDLKETGKYNIDENSIKKLKSMFWGGWAGEHQTSQAIRSAFKDMNYLLDPHTAVAYWVLDDYRKKTGDKSKSLIVSTASPFKFAPDVLKAITDKPLYEKRDEFEILDDLSKLSGISIPYPLAGLKGKSVLHKASCTKENMKNTVEDIFNIK